MSRSEFDAHLIAIRAADETHKLFDTLRRRVRLDPVMPIGTKVQQVEAAIYYQKHFGTKYAAKFLRSRGWSFEDAMNVLQLPRR